MATTFKNFLSNDVANTRTLLHEAIPITGSIVSGTYTENNIKTYGHGIFESTYDYPFLSSSANHIFDTTIGYASTSQLSGAANTQNSKKINIYNQMAQYLVGYDETGSIKKFVQPVTGDTMLGCYFLPLSRLLTKDEIKKGSFTLELGVSGSYTQGGTTFEKRVKLIDHSGSNGYHVDSPAGEYGVLYGTTSVGATKMFTDETLGDATTMPAVGLIYYQAGVVVLSGSVFMKTADGGHLVNADPASLEMGTSFSTTGFHAVTGSTIEVMAASLRNRIYNISFNNTTELNSTIYFCRAGHGDFNYSSNPTYLSGSTIRVKTRASDTPVSYFTTIGLYSADNELLAVAKVSEPLRKDPTSEITLRVRLDF